MFEEFLVRALLAGSLLGLVTGPLGCFVVWRRMAYFGDTIAHAGLLGVALALLTQINIVVGVFAVACLISLALFLIERRTDLSNDALLGILSHSTLAIGLVTISFMTWIRIDLNAFLFGDILAVTLMDIALIAFAGLGALLVLWRIWTPLLAATVNADLAAAEGHRPRLVQFILTLLLSLIIAISMKLVGILLITALLVIPAAAARKISRTPESMAIIAAGLGVLSVFGGLNLSLQLDTPSGPSIVVSALVLFLVSLVLPGRRQS